MRWLYFINILFLGTVSASVYAERLAMPSILTVWGNTQNTGTWYQQIKPYCNPVEVGMAFKRNPPPEDETSQAYAAACYSLSGKIELAKQTLDRFPDYRQEWAANIVFNVAHPIADMGDDKSAGPIMQLVVHYNPDHYMALYHAGISLYATGDPTESRRHLAHFLEIYKTNDGWTKNARMVLEKIESKS